MVTWLYTFSKTWRTGHSKGWLFLHISYTLLETWGEILENKTICKTKTLNRKITSPGSFFVHTGFPSPTRTPTPRERWGSIQKEALGQHLHSFLFLLKARSPHMHKPAHLHFLILFVVPRMLPIHGLMDHEVERLATAARHPIKKPPTTAPSVLRGATLTGAPSAGRVLGTCSGLGCWLCSFKRLQMQPNLMVTTAKQRANEVERRKGAMGAKWKQQLRQLQRQQVKLLKRHNQSQRVDLV